MAAECECKLGFLPLGRWCKAMAVVRQLAVCCLDVLVIAVSSTMCLTSISTVAYGSDRDIAT